MHTNDRMFRVTWINVMALHICMVLCSLCTTCMYIVNSLTLYPFVFALCSLGHDLHISNLLKCGGGSDDDDGGGCCCHFYSFPLKIKKNSVWLSCLT